MILIMESSGPPLFIPKDLPQYMENQRKLELGNILHIITELFIRMVTLNGLEIIRFLHLDDNGNIIQLNGLISDITEQKVLNEKVKYLSDYDSLTKLPNRQKFIEKLQELIDEYANSNNQFAVMKLDIDRFQIC